MPRVVITREVLDWLATLELDDELCARLALRSLSQRVRVDGVSARRIDELIAELGVDAKSLAQVLRCCHEMTAALEQLLCPRSLKPPIG